MRIEKILTTPKSTEFSELASFWVGGKLSPLEQASAISFMSQGHKFILYVMDDVKEIPNGVIVKDAREILPIENVIRHSKSGSPALHSDLFRYALIGKTNQIWVDLDIIALQPFSFDTDYIFGYESPHEVNGAVLKLPKSSTALKDLLKYTPEIRGYPPFLKTSRKFKYFLKSFGQGLPIEKWPWGSLGPRALTYHLSKTSEINFALPTEAFYPIPFENAENFLIPNLITAESFSIKTYGVHFWGNAVRKLLKSKYNGNIHADSYLGKCILDLTKKTNITISLSI